MSRIELTIERVHPSGAYRIAAIVGGYYVARVYMGYTRREAARRFRAELREGARS